MRYKKWFSALMPIVPQIYMYSPPFISTAEILVMITYFQAMLDLFAVVTYPRDLP